MVPDITSRIAAGPVRRHNPLCCRPHNAGTALLFPALTVGP